MATVDSSDEEGPEQLQCKIILIGDGAVGKTSVATRLQEDHFATAYKQTIGLDFFMKRIELPGEIQVALQVWDIGGQSIGSKMISNYIYGAHIVLPMASFSVLGIFLTFCMEEAKVADRLGVTLTLLLTATTYQVRA